MASGGPSWRPRAWLRVHGRSHGRHGHQARRSRNNGGATASPWRALVLSRVSEVEVVAHNGVPIARVRGEIDLSNAEEVLQSIEGAIDEGSPGLAVDLRELAYVDSAGVRLLFRAARAVAVTGGLFVAIVAPESPAQRVLDLAEAATLFPLEATEQAALQRLAAGVV